MIEEELPFMRAGSPEHLGMIRAAGLAKAAGQDPDAAAHSAWANKMTDKDFDAVGHTADVMHAGLSKLPTSETAAAQRPTLDTHMATAARIGNVFNDRRTPSLSPPQFGSPGSSTETALNNIKTAQGGFRPNA